MFSFCCQSQYFSHCFLKNTFPFFLSFLRILECHETYMNVISFSWDGEQDFIQQQSLVMEDAGCMWFNTESLHISAAVGLTCSAYSMGSLLKICIFQYCGCLMALTNKKTVTFHMFKGLKRYHRITSWKPGQIFPYYPIWSSNFLRHSCETALRKIIFPVYPTALDYRDTFCTNTPKESPTDAPSS